MLSGFKSVCVWWGLGGSSVICKWELSEERLDRPRLSSNALSIQIHGGVGALTDWMTPVWLFDTHTGLCGFLHVFIKAHSENNNPAPPQWCVSACVPMCNTSPNGVACPKEWCMCVEWFSLIEIDHCEMERRSRRKRNKSLNTHNSSEGGGDWGRERESERMDNNKLFMQIKHKSISSLSLLPLLWCGIFQVSLVKCVSACVCF